VFTIRRIRLSVRIAEDGTSVSAAWRLAGRRIGCAVIVCTAAVALGLSVHHGLQTTAALLRPASIRSAVVADRQEECIYRAIRSELPKGAAVYISDPVHVQRLAELSTLWAVPQASRAAARWTIALVPVSSVGPGSRVPWRCYGLTLKVRRT
jgi:hypothetical protein